MGVGGTGVVVPANKLREGQREGTRWGRIDEVVRGWGAQGKWWVGISAQM